MSDLDEFTWLDTHGVEQGRRPTAVYAVQWRYRDATTRRAKSSIWVAQRLSDAKRCMANIIKWDTVAGNDNPVAIFKGTIEWEEVEAS